MEGLIIKMIEEEENCKKNGYSVQEINEAKNLYRLPLIQMLQLNKEFQSLKIQNNSFMNTKNQLETDITNKNHIIYQLQRNIQDLETRLTNKISENESLIQQLEEIRNNQNKSNN